MSLAALGLLLSLTGTRVNAKPLQDDVLDEVKRQETELGRPLSKSEVRIIFDSKLHGVSFAESVDAFFDSNGIRLIDESHSNIEKRFYWVGKSKSGRILTTYFTQRGDKVRIIGCAEWRKFRRIYHEATKNK